MYIYYTKGSCTFAVLELREERFWALCACHSFILAMENSAYVVAGLVIILSGYGVARVSYLNEKRRVLHGTSGACSRKKEYIFASLVGLLLGGVVIPLFLAGIFIARALARRDAVSEISGLSAARQEEMNKHILRQRSSSLENLYSKNKVAREIPQEVVSHSPTPLKSAKLSISESNHSSNDEPVPFEQDGNNEHQSELNAKPISIHVDASNEEKIEVI